MTSINQKRIQELEAQLKAAQDQVNEFDATNFQLTYCLHSIATAPDYTPAPELQTQAEQVLEDTQALVHLQQRDLNIAYLTVSRMVFPTNIRKMWSGQEVQHWINQYADLLKARALAHGADKIDKKETLQ